MLGTKWVQSEAGYLGVVQIVQDKEVVMQNILSSVTDNLNVFIPILIVLITFVVVYLVLMVRAVIDMLRYDVHGVLLTFAFLALIPFPLLIVLGIMILIIWHYHKKDIMAGKRQSRHRV
jgi:hypothetical protein